MDKYLFLVLRRNYQGVQSHKQSLSQEDFKKFNELFSMLALLCKPSEKEISEDHVLWELASKSGISMDDFMKEILKLSYEKQKEFLVFFKEQIRQIKEDDCNIFKDEPVFNFLSLYLNQVRWGSPEELAALSAMEKIIRINEFNGMTYNTIATFDYLLKSCSLFPDDHPEKVPLRIAYIVVCYFICISEYPKILQISNNSFLMLIQAIKRSLSATSTKKHLFLTACVTARSYFSAKQVDHFGVPLGTTETHLFFNSFAPIINDSLKHSHDILHNANTNEILALLLPLSIRGNPQDKNYTHPLLPPEQLSLIPFRTKIWGPSSFLPSPESKQGYHPTSIRTGSLFNLINLLFNIGTNKEFEKWLGKPGLEYMSLLASDYIRAAKLVSESSEYVELAREETLIRMTLETSQIINIYGVLSAYNSLFNIYFCTYFKPLISDIIEMLRYPHSLSITNSNNELAQNKTRGVFRRSQPFLLSPYIRGRVWDIIYEILEKESTSNKNMDILLEIGLCKAFVCAVAGEYVTVEQKKKNKKNSKKEKKKNKKKRYFMMEMDKDAIKNALKSFSLILNRYNREYRVKNKKNLKNRLLEKTMDILYEEDIISALLLWKYTFKIVNPAFMTRHIILGNNSGYLVGKLLNEFNIPSSNLY